MQLGCWYPRESSCSIYTCSFCRSIFRSNRWGLSFYRWCFLEMVVLDPCSLRWGLYNFNHFHTARNICVSTKHRFMLSNEVLKSIHIQPYHYGPEGESYASKDWWWKLLRSPRKDRTQIIGKEHWGYHFSAVQGFVPRTHAYCNNSVHERK